MFAQGNLSALILKTETNKENLFWGQSRHMFLILEAQLRITVFT